MYLLFSDGVGGMSVSTRPKSDARHEEPDSSERAVQLY